MEFGHTRLYEQAPEHMVGDVDKEYCVYSVCGCIAAKAGGGKVI